jgi:hypothetical protein
MIMSEKGKNQDRAGRAKRRAEALRENLRRRKLQARSRGAASGKAAQGRAEEQSGPDTGKR